MYERMNKLVRDNIPDIIKQTGDKPDFVILDSPDYYNELKKKLTEEVSEFNDSDEIMELCDVVEVISAIWITRTSAMKNLKKCVPLKIKPTVNLKKEYFLTALIE